MASSDELKVRWEQVTGEVTSASLACGRSSSDVRLLAVSKGQTPESIEAVYHFGQREFGENYVQEMVAKAEALSHLPDLKLVFIGAIQSNKLAQVARVASEVQSIGSVRHAVMLDRHLKGLGKKNLPVYLLVNAGDEATKHGFKLDEVVAASREITSSCTELVVRGLMAIPPILPDVEAGKLYQILHDLAGQVGAGELSLGMSQDLKLAISHGSNCVRIGTALFGPRHSV